MASFWQRLRFKYRVSALNENTLNEVWHIRLSRMGLIAIMFLLFLIAFAMLTALILFTPIRNYLPGYDENIRQELITQSVRVDSLTETMDLQVEYLNIIKDIVSGNIGSDSIPSLDSMAVIQREQLLDQRSAITEEFIAQYEEKERDNLGLFVEAASTPSHTCFRPMRGEVIQHANPRQRQYGVMVRTTTNENISSVMAGTVVNEAIEPTGGWTITVQHNGGYMSVYQHIKIRLKHLGDNIQAGETLGLAGDELIGFELWHNGVSINPEEVIIF